MADPGMFLVCGSPRQGTTLLASPVDAAAVGAFPQSLDPAVADASPEQAGEVMRAFGYARRTFA